MKLTEAIGVLGFALSIITFALTRWERRKKITIDMFIDHGTRFREEIDKESEDPILIVRFINDGQRPIVIDCNSLVFYGNEHPVPWWKTDCLGKNTFPPILNTGVPGEVGIFLESFVQLVGAPPNSEVEVSVTVKDIDGKCYRPTSIYNLLLEVNEINHYNKKWWGRIINC